MGEVVVAAVVVILSKPVVEPVEVPVELSVAVDDFDGRLHAARFWLFPSR